MEGLQGLLTGCLETMGDRQALASYFQEGGRDMVGDGERSRSGWEGASMMNFSMRDCLRAKSSAPFPLASVRLWLGCGFGFGWMVGDLRQDDHAGASSAGGRCCPPLAALLGTKLEASAPRAKGSSSAPGSPCSFCFFLMSALCTKSSRSGLGPSFGFSTKVNMDFLWALRAADSSRMPVLGRGGTAPAPWTGLCSTFCSTGGYRAE